MSKASTIVSYFCLTGKLIKVNYQKDQIKYIKLATDDGNYWIKVTKKLRGKIARISCGSSLKVNGKSKQKSCKSKTKYKATMITLISQDALQNEEIKVEKVSLSPIFDTQIKSEAKVLICQKSNCWKKGGQKVYKALESVLNDRDLTGQIPIKKTGCLKKCKKAPNLVILPDKAFYTKVKTKQIESFVEKHLITET